MEEGLSLGGDHVTTLQFGFLRCHLPALRAADYTHSPNIAVRILTALMDYPNTPEARVRVYGQAWQGLLELEPDPDQLVKYLGIIHTYLKLNTTEQQLYARLYPQEKRHMNQLAESWIEKGWQKGRQEGILLGEHRQANSAAARKRWPSSWPNASARWTKPLPSAWPRPVWMNSSTGRAVSCRPRRWTRCSGCSEHAPCLIRARREQDKTTTACH